MLDFSGEPARRDVQYLDKNLIKGAQTYRKALSIIRKAVGKNVYLFGSSGPTNLSLGIENGMRIGLDSGGQICMARI